MLSYSCLIHALESYTVFSSPPSQIRYKSIFYVYVCELLMIYDFNESLLSWLLNDLFKNLAMTTTTTTGGEEFPKKLQLYSIFMGTPSFRVRIALNLKGLDYEYKAINLFKRQQHNPLRVIIY
ncbi:hypothetical protein L6452_40761 [Arctium lappa]|uniref:Uncharacterized protein n=1 Tax=Arctium lappa TaxID=4217 RepID=A0ACB8XN21_ARCLA|nr:hypothetical protein L6452_40761 [Arctium lappa]